VSRGVVAVVASVLASAALVLAYVGLGGGDFEPTPPPDPCARTAPEAAEGGVTGTVERLGLTALGAAACDLGVSRERLLLGLAGEAELGVDRERRADAFRAGLRTAIDEEERAGRLGGTEAFLLRQAVGFLPVDALLERFFRSG
jgi:hypothetical protein